MHKSILLFTVFIHFVTAAFAETETDSEQASNNERVAYLEPEQKKQQALAETLKPHEIVWLDVNYPDTPESYKVLAIAHQSLIAEEEGAILLLHDKEQHADWPQMIKPLRTALPEFGWNTLSLSLPDDTPSVLPERKLAVKGFDRVVLSDTIRASLASGKRSRSDASDGAESSAEPASSVNADGSDGPDSADNANSEEPVSDPQSAADESVDIDLAAAKKQDINKIPYELRAQSHIEKAFEHLKSENYQNLVLIAHRHSAELVFNYIKAHQAEITTPGFAIILIEPMIAESYLLEVSDWLGDSFSVPILELVSRPNAEAVRHAKSRALKMKKAGVASHKQLFLMISNTEAFNESLTKRVKFWLKEHAAGKVIPQ